MKKFEAVEVWLPVESIVDYARKQTGLDKTFDGCSFSGIVPERTKKAALAVLGDYSERGRKNLGAAIIGNKGELSKVLFAAYI